MKKPLFKVAIFLLLLILVINFVLASFSSVTNFGTNGVKTCVGDFYAKKDYSKYCSSYFGVNVGNNDACACDGINVVCCNSINDRGIIVCDKGNSFTAEDGSGKVLTCCTVSNEVCDGVDNDCDGSTDEGVKTTYYRDADGDGYGNSSITTAACSVPSGYVSNSTDCDDSRSSVNPGATEVCNERDDDCDGKIDEDCVYGYFYPNWRFVHTGSGYCKFIIYTGLARTAAGDWNQINVKGNYVGNDINFLCRNADGNQLINLQNKKADLNSAWGYNAYHYTISSGVNKNFSKHTWECWGYVTNSNGSRLRIQTVMNDRNSSASFFITTSNEVCDGIDNDCDGLVDEGVKNSCGACGPILVEETCCNGLDDNCNGQIDEGCTCECVSGENENCSTEKLGVCSIGTRTCTNWVWEECVQTINASEEVCDGLDNDCDGLIDNGANCDKVCLNCTNVNNIVKIDLVSSQVIDGNIFLDYNVLCDVGDQINKTEIKLDSLIIKKGDELIEDVSLQDSIECNISSKNISLVIPDCEIANYSIDFNMSISQSDCDEVKNCTNINKIYTSTYCSNEKSTSSIPDNSIISVIFVLLIIVFLSFKNKKK